MDEDFENEIADSSDIDDDDDYICYGCNRKMFFRGEYCPECQEDGTEFLDRRKIPAQNAADAT